VETFFSQNALSSPVLKPLHNAINREQHKNPSITDPATMGKMEMSAPTVNQ